MSILISGGTRGIGLAIARAFAQPGADVFLNYRADDRQAEAAKAEIEGSGAACHLIKGDVGTPAGAKAVIEAVAAVTGRLDQLVHCAVTVLAEPTLSVDARRFTKAVQVNGLALLYLVQEARPLFRRGSTVFFLSSRGSRVVVPDYAAVGVGKALAEALVRYLSVELAPLGVRANCVAPAMVDTAALRSVFGDKTDAMLEDAARRNPSGRRIRDEDYTGLIKFLASPAAEMIQGQVVFVNGGDGVMA